VPIGQTIGYVTLEVTLS